MPRLSLSLSLLPLIGLHVVHPVVPISQWKCKGTEHRKEVVRPLDRICQVSGSNPGPETDLPD
jgi:hypothetical protein